MKRVIRLGDPTNHGGNVVSGSPSSVIFDKPVARQGDQVTCPKQGHSNCVIAEGDPEWLVDGRPVALEGHKTSCGAVLISTLGMLNRDWLSDNAAVIAQTQPAQQIGDLFNPTVDKNELEQYFEFLDIDSDTAIEGLTYKIQESTKVVVNKMLLSDGKTEMFAMTDHPEELSITAWY